MERRADEPSHRFPALVAIAGLAVMTLTYLLARGKGDAAGLALLPHTLAFVLGLAAFIAGTVRLLRRPRA